MIDGLVGVDGGVRLVDVADADGLADGKLAAVDRFLAHDHAEEGGLTGAVGADDAHNAVGRKHEVEVVEKESVAESLGYVLRLDHLVAEARAVGDEDFELRLALLLILVEEGFVRVQTGLTLGLTRLGGHANPLQLALERLATFAGLLLFLGHALGLLVEPRGVVATPGDALAAVELEDPTGDVIEEVAVVGDADDGAGVLLEVLLEPVDGLGVEVVRGLVEEKDVGLLEEQAAEGYATTFAAGERVHDAVFGRAAQGVHGALEATVEVPCVEGVNAVL